MSNSRKYRILGIDPGTRVTGYGIIESTLSFHTTLDYGCIRPPPSKSLHERYHILFTSVEALIEKYAPDAVAVETQFVSKNAQSALKLGMARGVVLLAATKNNIEIFEYAPKVAKKAAVGRGSASKEEVQRMIQILLQLKEPPTPEDAADALSIALCHIHRMNHV